MSEVNFIITASEKAERYQQFLEQVKPCSLSQCKCSFERSFWLLLGRVLLGKRQSTDSWALPRFNGLLHYKIWKGRLWHCVEREPHTSST